MVLVAAVAAAVLINTSGYLQQRAMATGKETTQQVSTGLSINQVIGHVSGSSMDKMAIYISLRPGSSPVDLNQTVITLDDGKKVVTLRYNTSANLFTNFVTNSSADNNGLFNNTTVTAWPSATSGKTSFGIIVVQDADKSVKATTPTIDAGDVVILTINTEAAFGTVPPRTHIKINIRPEVGAPAFATIVTPSSYSQQTILNLYP